MKLRIFTVLFLISVISTAQERISITHGPYLLHLTEKSVTIVWTTNKKAVSWVELAPDDRSHFYLTERPKFFSAKYGFKDISTVNVVSLDNLNPGTSYRYRIFSQEVTGQDGTNVNYGRTVATNVYDVQPLKFTTADPSKEKKISFLVVNDIHGRNKLLENLLIKGDYQHSDFVIFNGDMVSEMRDEEQFFKGFLDTADSLFAREKPFYYTRGNHETRGEMSGMFPYYFPSPTGNLYYMFHRGPACFLVLDCGEDKPDSDIEYSGLAAFDQYRSNEEVWLREAVKNPDFINAPFKIVIIHMPPFGGWHGEQQVIDKFVPLLNKAGIDVMLCGHLHQTIKNLNPGNGINFPVIVNSNTTVLKVDVDSEFLNLKIINEKGETVDSARLKAK